MNIPILFLLAWLFVSFANCTTDYFGFSGLGSKELSSTEPNEPASTMVYCNKFDTNGFRGILTAYYNWDQDTFNTNKARLFLWNVPYEFKYPPTSYIQIHSFNITNNKKAFKQTPVSVEVIKSSSDQKLNVVTTIGHDFLNEIEVKDIDDMIQNHSFVLKDIEGWHGVTLSVFDEKNQPVKTTAVLIPPFEANPHTFLNANNHEKFLSELHPFKNIAAVNANDKIFYEKGIDFCKDSPIQFDIPPLSESSLSITEDTVVNELLKDLSRSD